MFVKDVIEELQKFPGLSTVFIQCYRCGGGEDDPVHKLDSIHEIWVVATDDGTALSGPYRVIKEDENGLLTEQAQDHGALLYG